MIRAGRTTRMLEEAVSLAKKGKAVYILTIQDDLKRMQQRIREVCEGVDYGIKCETTRYFNWHTMRVDGAHYNCVFLVDHYAIERRFANVLEMLHRFDLPVQE